MIEVIITVKRSILTNTLLQVILRVIFIENLVQKKHRIIETKRTYHVNRRFRDVILSQ